MKTYQFIWDWNEWAWGYRRLNLDDTDLAYIYAWFLFIGPLEIRKWEIA